MPMPPGHLELAFLFDRQGNPTRPKPASGLGHVLFVADYSGAAQAEHGSSRFVRRSLQIDPLSAQFCIVPGQVTLGPLTRGGLPFTLPIADTDALHPDNLLDSVPELAALWHPLRDLFHDQTAAQRLEALLAEVSAEPPPPDGDDALLGRLLGRRPVHAEAVPPPADSTVTASAERLVHRLAERALATGSEGKHWSASSTGGDLRARVEAELQARLRALLSQEGFRRASATWFATEMVVRACPDDSRTRFSAVQASWQELASDPAGLREALSDGVSVMLVDHRFGPGAEELASLVGLVRVCKEHDVFLVTGASASLAGWQPTATHGFQLPPPPLDAWQAEWSEEAREAWAELGSLRQAGAQFALALPRCLVRQPYGERGEPLEKIEFEELGERPDPADFPWANGAYLVVQALMEQWCGGQTQLDGSHEIRGLPIVTVSEGDARGLQPPLEATLPAAAVEQLLTQGFSVIEAVQNSDRARVHL